MTHTSAEIARLRIAAGLSESSLAEALGITIDAYSDLERYDDELTTAVTLRQARTLAQLLGVDLLALLSLPEQADHKTLKQLAAELSQQVESGGITLQELEAAVGWELVTFLAAPQEVADRNPVMFLQDLASHSNTSCSGLVASAHAA